MSKREFYGHSIMTGGYVFLQDHAVIRVSLPSLGYFGEIRPSELQEEERELSLDELKAYASRWMDENTITIQEYNRRPKK